MSRPKFRLFSAVLLACLLLVAAVAALSLSAPDAAAKDASSASAVPDAVPDEASPAPASLDAPAEAASSVSVAKPVVQASQSLALANPVPAMQPQEEITGEIVSVVAAPNPVTGGEQAVFTVTVRNTGTTAWDPSGVEAEVVLIDEDGTQLAAGWGSDAVPFETVDPGTEAVVFTYLQVPWDLEGTYRYRVKLWYFSTQIDSYSKEDALLEVTSVEAPVGGSEYGALLSNRLFLHAASVLDFDVQAFLNTQSGPLKNYTERINGQPWTAGRTIQFNAIFFGVNPQLILILLEAQGNTLTDPTADVPVRADSNQAQQGSTFYYHVRWITEKALTSFDRRRYHKSDNEVAFPTGERLTVPVELNAGTYAVQVALAQILPPDQWEQWVQGTSPSFRQQFSYWFGNPLEGLDQVRPAVSSLPSGYILPFTVGEKWYYTGGPHHYTGINHCAAGTSRENCPPGAWSSIDIAPPESISCPGGSYPANRWIVSAKGGTVVQSSQGLVVIDHGDGWRTYYSHVSTDDRRGTGNINRGDHVGHPSCEVEPGGSTTGVHVHFAIWHQDVGFVDIDGSSLSDWGIQETTHYNGTMTREGVTRTANVGRLDDTNDILNSGVSSGGGGGGQAVDLVFPMDTSGSMNDEFSTLCGKISDIVTDLESRGITVRYKILGITQNRDCTSDTVSNLVPGGRSNHSEDWGPATYDLSHGYDWLPGYVRMIIPMSDEGPENGNRCYDPGEDRDAIEDAIAAAQANDIRVSPVLGSWWSAGEAPCITQLAEDLASATGGRVFYSTEPSTDLAAGIADLVAGAVPPSLRGDSAPPSEGPRYTAADLAREAAWSDEVFYDSILPESPTEQDLQRSYQFGGVITLTIPISRYYGATIDPSNPGPLSPELRGKAVPDIVKLTIMAYDVDSYVRNPFEYAPDPLPPHEEDWIYVNGQPIDSYFVGQPHPEMLDGRDKEWVPHDYDVPVELLNFPTRTPSEGLKVANNTITIEVDHLNQEYATAVAWARLRIPGLRPTILVRGFDVGNYLTPLGFLPVAGSHFSYWSDWFDYLGSGAPTGWLVEEGFPNAVVPIGSHIDPENSDVLVPVEGTELYSENGPVIRRKVRDILDGYGVDKVNLVGHSKGGIDIREALGREIGGGRSGKLGEYVDTVVTLGSPHEGIPVDIIRLLPFDAAKELTYGGMDQFNSRHYSFNDERFVSLIGNQQDAWYHKVLRIASFFRDEQSDSFIEIKSATGCRREGLYPDYYRTGFIRTDFEVNHSEEVPSESMFNEALRYLKPSALGGEQRRQPDQPNSCDSTQATLRVGQSNSTAMSQHVAKMTGTIAGGVVQTHALALEGESTSVSLIWPYADAMGLTLVDPDGIPLDPAALPGTISYTHSLTGTKYLNYLLQSPQTGWWTAEVTVTNSYTGGEPYMLVADAVSPLVLETSIPQTLYSLGDTIVITAAISDTGQPVTGATVSTTVTVSDTLVTTLDLLDDGQHNDGEANDGVYGGVLTDTTHSGSYFFEVRAAGVSGGTPFTRLGYAQATVASGAARLLSYAETAMDSDGDGLFNTLAITANVETYSTGQYQVVGQLTNQSGTAIASTSAFISGTAGTHPAVLSFDGQIIAQSGLDGPYQLREMYLIDPNFPTPVQADYQALAYTTAAYSASQFQRDSIILSSPITDTGVDVNGNGLYEFLRVTTPLDIRNAGIYTATVNLVDDNGRGITGFTKPYSLTAGLNTLVFNFNGPAINLYDVDGPYQVKNFLVSRSSTETLEVTDLHTTQPYSSTTFEADSVAPSSAIDPLPAVITTTPIIQVNWDGSDPDPSSGIALYDVQYKTGSTSTWTDWLTQTALTYYPFGPTDPVTVTSGETYYFQVRATDYAGNQESYPGGDGDTHTTMVGADLEVNKSTITQFIQEHTADYSINYKNDGPFPAQNVLLTDTLPSGLSYVADTSGITPTVSGNTLVWSLGTVPAFANRSFKLTTYVTPTLVGGTMITNALDISTPDQESDYTNNHAVAGTTVITATSDMYVEKWLNSGTPVPGADIRYRIRYRNTGNSEATDVFITDTLPISTTYVSDNNSAGFTTVITGSTVVWSKPSVSSNESGYLYLTAHISDTLSGGETLTNTVEVSTSRPETDYANNVYTRAIEVQPRTRDMQVTKSLYSNSSMAAPGNEIEYRIYYRNEGNTQATDITITDTLPISTTYVADHNSAGFTSAVAGNEVVWTKSAVNPNESGYLYLQAQILETANPGDDLVNRVEIATGDPDVLPGNNVYTHTQPVQAPTRDMYVDKWLDAGNATAGNDLTYEIRYRNNGNYPAADVVIADTLPTSTTYLSFSGPYTPTVVGNRVVWNLGTVPKSGDSGYQGNLWVTAHLSESTSVGTILTNTAEISTSDTETSYSNNVDRDTRTVYADSPDLRLYKYFDSSEAPQGSEVIYRLNYRNNSYDAATDVIITDTLPMSVTYVSTTGAPEPNIQGRQLTWHLGSIPGRYQPGYQGDIYLIGYISEDVPVGTVLTNTAAITTPNDTNVGNNSGEVGRAVTIASRDLYVEKSLQSGIVAPGNDLTYRIYYRNYGNAHLPETVITDTLPSGISFVSANGDFTPTVTGSTVVWHLDTVPGYGAQGYNGYLYLTVHIPDTIPEGTVLRNRVVGTTSATETGTRSNWDEYSSIVQAHTRDLRVYKQHYNGTPLASNDITYRLRVYNDGNTPATTVHITDTLPVSTTYVSWSGDERFTLASTDGREVVWTVDELPANFSSDYIYLTVHLDESLPSDVELINRLEVGSTDVETNYSNNVATHSMYSLAEGRDLKLTKEWSGGSPLAGNTLSYRLNYANLGTESANNVVITDTLPVSTTFYSTYAGGWSHGINGRVITWTRSSLSSQSWGSINLTVYVTDTVPIGTLLINEATIASDSADANPANNTASLTMAVAAGSRDLYVDKTVSDGIAVPGSEITYRIHYRNYGAVPAGDVIITDTLPSGMSYVSASGNFTPTVDGNHVVWQLGTVPGQYNSGYRGELYLTVRIDESVPIGMRLFNAVEITTVDQETGFQSNSDTYQVTIQPPTRDIRVNKYLYRGNATRGNEIRYRLNVHNDGTTTASNVVLTDTLPAEMSYLATLGNYTPTVQGNTISWHLGTLTGNSGLSIDYMAHISETVPLGTQLVNRAIATLDETDSDPGDNEDQYEMTVIEGESNLYLSKSLWGSQVPQGSQVMYQLYYRNQNTSAATPVTITDILPVGLRFVSASPGPAPTGDGQTVSWHLPSVPGDSSSVILLTAYVSDTLAVGTTVTNTAVITAPNDAYAANNSDSDVRTVVAGTRDLRIDKWLEEGDVEVGSDITYGIYYENDGNSSADNVVITDTLPMSTTYVAHSGSFTPTVAGNNVIWNLGTVPGQGTPGSYGELYVTAHIDESVPADTIITNTVTITTSQIDDYDGNNTASVALQVIEPFTQTADILFVPDNGGYNTTWFESYFTTALEDAGYRYDVWDTELRGAVYSDTLNLYLDGAVIWAVPEWGYLGQPEVQSAIEAYLDAGGRLFITGQDVAYGMAGSSFLNDYLHAVYVQDDPGLRTLQGVAGDVIGDGLTLGISGGDGADNQWYPDEIDPLGPADAIFVYDSGATATESKPEPPDEDGRKSEDGRPTGPRAAPPAREARERREKKPPEVSPTEVISSGTGGLRVDTGTYKVVYFSFGFEGINDAGDRAAVMNRVVAWLHGVPPRPLQIRPADGAAVPMGDTPFTWMPVDGVSDYEIQIDTTDTFTSPALIDAVVSTTSYTATLPAGNWYWRVRALPDGEWTGAWAFLVAQPVLQVTSDPADDWRPSITRTADGSLWAVWHAQYDGNNDIWYKTSNDNGATWSTAVQLTTDQASDYDPAIIQASGGTLWVVWYSYRSGNADLWYKTSTDGGATWSDANRLTDHASWDGAPVLAQSGDGTIWVAWESSRSGNQDIWYKTSDDSGATWSAATQLTTHGASDWWPGVVAANDGTMWIVWESDRYEVADIWYKTSSDGGTTWSEATPLITSYNWDYWPAIGQSADGTMWVVWSSWRSANSDVWYTTSSDGGATWSTHRRFTQFTGWDEAVAVAPLSGNQAALAWHSDRAVNFDIWFGIVNVHGDVNPPPHLDDVWHEPWPNPEVTESTTIIAEVSDDTGIAGVTLKWSQDGTVQSDLTMYDDGLHGDYGANDGWYGVEVGSFPIGTVIEYQVEIADVAGNNILAPQDPMQFETLEPFEATTDILLVPDDGGDDTGWFRSYYEDALLANGYAYDLWDTGRRGQIEPATLMSYTNGAVIWAVPWDGFVTDEEYTRELLRSYLDNGGDLFISGQDIGFYVGWTSFYQDYLHASYVQDSVNLWNVAGVSGDPIGDGISFSIAGGDGANNQGWPSEIDPVAPATTIFTYVSDTAQTSQEFDMPAVRQLAGALPRAQGVKVVRETDADEPLDVISSGSAAIRVDTGTYQAVYFAFGLEGIADSTTRQQVMERVLNWLGVSPPPVISDIRTTNVRDTSFTVSWVTDRPAAGEVHYGTDPANLDQIAQDIRGAETNDDTHYVVLTGLSPETTYYFDVVSGSTIDDDGGAHYSVTTGPTLGVPASDTIYGEVFKEDGAIPAEGTVIYITLQDADGDGSPGQAAPLSALVNSDGYWSTNLGNARSVDLSSYFDYSVSGDRVRLEAQGAGDGTGCQLIDTADDTPAADVVLNISECEISWAVDLQAGWNYTSLPLDPLTSHTAESLCTEINAQGGDVVEIDRWYASGWDGHVCGVPFNNFDIELGSNYFIKSNAGSTWTIQGHQVGAPVPLDLQVGWNSIGIPHSDAYPASTLCNDIIAQGVTAVEIDRWYASGWDGHVCGLSFNDFDIERGHGYFVRAASAGVVTPTAPATVFQAGREAKQTTPPSLSERLHGAASTIHDLQVSNLRDTAVTVSWVTDQPVTGHVVFGSTSKLNQAAYDVRGPATTDTTHYVVVTGLAPETTYYFDVVSGSGVDDNGGNHYTVTTGAQLDSPPPSDTVYGQVFWRDGVTPAPGTIVYLTVRDEDGAGSPGESLLMSALVDEHGYWHANLGNARQTDGSASFVYSGTGDAVRMTAQKRAADIVTRTDDVRDLRPAAPLVLSSAPLSVVGQSELYLPLIMRSQNTGPTGGRLTGTVQNGVSITTRGIEPAYREGELLLKFRADISANQRAAVISPLGTVTRHFEGLDLYHLNLKRSMSVRQALFGLRKNPAILYAEPNHVWELAEGPAPASTLPNDVRFDEQWGLHNTGQTGGTVDADIDAPEAWDITSGSRDVVVAVIDSGVDYNHEDLAGNMWVNHAEANGTAGVDDDGNGYVDDVYGIDTANNDSDPMDDHGHGTHVAGTIGAIGNNGVGVVGINWQVAVMALKFLAADGTGFTSDAVEALEYAIMMKQEYGVNVIVASNSWGGGGYSQAMFDAIEAARNANVLFVAAAGNDTSDNDGAPFYPASYTLDNVIAVAATNDDDQLASFSNWGATSVNVAAPGVNILSTLPGNAYDSWSGTSMATPHVSAIAALIASAHLEYTWIQIKNLILNTVDLLPNLQGKVLTEGRINAHSALTCDGSAPMEVRVLNPPSGFEAPDTLTADIQISLGQCADPVTDATVTAHLSNGEPNLTLTHQGNGRYAAQWQPTIIGNVTITIEVTSPTYGSVQEQINGEVIHLPQYTWDEATYNWVEISETGISLALGDDEVVSIVSPFDLTFYNQRWRELTIGSNGQVNFDGNYLGFINAPIPSVNDYSVEKLVAPFWDDLIMEPARETGLVYTDVRGQAPHRQLIIEWKDVAHYSGGGTATFEIVFFEDRPDILMQYQDAEFGVGEYDYGASATIGVQYNADWGTQFSYNSPALRNQMALRFSTDSPSLISDVHPANVRDTSFVVSWLTDQPATGEVHYGMEPASLDQIAYDDRGEGVSDDTHYVTVENLQPTTTYYFNIVSGGVVDDNAGAHYTVTTGATLDVPASDTIYGQVFKEDGTAPAEGSVIYITLVDGDGSGSPGEAAPLSALVDDTGYWSANLGNARTSSLADYFDYTASGDQVRLKAQGASDGVGCLRVDTADDAPATDIVLNVSACTATQTIPVQAGWNHLALPLAPLTSYAAEDLCDEINYQGGGVIEIDRWYAGGWEGHICGLAFNDFPLETNSSYFLKSDAASNWTIEGYRVTTGVPLDLQIGWNTIGLPHSDGYTASSLCEEISNQGVLAVEIDRWYAGGWEGHVCGLPFSNFDIRRGYGYFIKADASGVVTPTVLAEAVPSWTGLPAR